MTIYLKGVQTWRQLENFGDESVFFFAGPFDVVSCSFPIRAGLGWWAVEERKRERGERESGSLKARVALFTQPAASDHLTQI